MNQSSSHMEHPKPEGPSKKQNDRHGDEHNPVLQLRMPATHRKVGDASQPSAADGCHPNREPCRRPTRSRNDYLTDTSVSSMTISTRRFFARPSAVALSATGWCLPYPVALVRCDAAIPASIR